MQCVTVIIQLVSRDHVCRFENGSQMAEESRTTYFPGVEQAPQQHCDTCIVIEIVGLLNIKIIYICLYANEKPSTRDPISVYSCMTIMDNG